MNPTLAAAALALLAAASARAGPPRVANPGIPAPDCTFHVNYDCNADLPGYRSGALCIPFMPADLRALILSSPNFWERTTALVKASSE